MEDKQFDAKIRSSFPFEPYSIQLEFSKTLYTALNSKKLCIFESPTGTGKSLSLISGAFNWLIDNEYNYKYLKKIINEREESTADNYEEDKNVNTNQHFSKGCQSSSLPEWFTSITDIREELFNQQRIERKNLLEDKKKKLGDFMQAKKDKIKFEQQIQVHKQKKDDEQKEEDELCVNWNEGDQEETIEDMLENYKKLKLEKKGGGNKDEDTKDEQIEPFKIIYSSRTHTQLKQFTEEIKKTPFKNLRVVTLGSRQNLCTNSNIDTSKMQLQQIEDYCQKAIGVNKSDKSVPKCSYFQNLKLLEEDLGYLFYQSIHSIDQMREISSSHHVCPYFLSKKSVRDSQVICVPYITLLDEKTRESSNLDIKNSIVIFDESHNILETLSQIHSASISFKVLFQSYSQLLTYYDKFCRKLNPKNALYIQTIKGLCLELMKFMKQQMESNSLAKNPTSYIKLNTISLLLGLNMDKIDLFQLKKFSEESRIGQKIHFFSLSPRYVQQKLPVNVLKILKDPSKDEVELNKSKEKMAVERVLQFLWKLQESISKGEQYSLMIKDIKNLYDSSVSILCLDVIEPLRKIIHESSCVILAGGTMEPLSEFQLLINQIGINKYQNFSCQHVIPASNCSVMTIEKIGNTNLLFNYQNKQNKSLLQASINMIQQLSQIIPHGLVIFVQSYSFLDTMREFLSENKNCLDEIQKYKKIYIDDKEGATSILEKYQKHIDQIKNKSKDTSLSNEFKSQNGAILISVIGGRLSEGINFSDELARCVVVLGMPYSNIKSADLIEKMNHYDKISHSRNSTFSGNDYYENMCMKAVNQAIGRSIRHKNDYATILLVDSRFSQDKNIGRLSGWIRKRLNTLESFEMAKKQIEEFFIKIEGRIE